MSRYQNCQLLTLMCHNYTISFASICSTLLFKMLQYVCHFNTLNYYNSSALNLINNQNITTIILFLLSPYFCLIFSFFQYLAIILQYLYIWRICYTLRSFIYFKELVLCHISVY